MMNIFSSIFSAPTKALISGGALCFAAYLLHSFNERTREADRLVQESLEQPTPSSPQRLTQTEGSLDSQAQRESSSTGQRAPASIEIDQEEGTASPQNRARATASTRPARETTSRRPDRRDEPEIDDYNRGRTMRSNNQRTSVYTPSSRSSGESRRAAPAPTRRQAVGGQPPRSSRGGEASSASPTPRRSLGGGFGTTFGDTSSGGGDGDATASSSSMSTDTSTYTTVSDTSSPSSSAPEPQDPPTCSHDMAEGVYGSEFEVTLSCSESSTIYYCIEEGGGCCDPYQSSVAYTGPIDIGPSDDNYCLAYYGVSNQSLLDSSLADVAYILDSTLPALATNFPLTQIQTTQLPLINTAESTDFGESDHYYHQVNLKSHDPVDYAWECADIYYDHATLSSPAPSEILLDYDVSPLSPTDEIEQAIELANLQYGDNFISTLLEDSGRQLFSCQTQRVVLQDFQIFSVTAGAGPSASTANGAFGWFMPYGHFQEVPNSSDSGEGKNLQGNQYLQHNFFAITH